MLWSIVLETCSINSQTFTSRAVASLSSVSVVIISVGLRYILLIVFTSISALRESLGISYYIRNTIVDELTKIVKTTYVQIGVIGTIDIKSISSNYESKTVRDCEIKYEDGSIVKIRCIKPIK